MIIFQLGFFFPFSGRHLNISTLFLTQNIYFKGNTSAQKYGRTVLINATDIVIFRSLRDHVGPLTLGRQVRGGCV